MTMLRTLLYLLVGAVFILPSAVTAQATSPVRIMALGDSITGSPVSPSPSPSLFSHNQTKPSPTPFP